MNPSFNEEDLKPRSAQKFNSSNEELGKSDRQRRVRLRVLSRRADFLRTFKFGKKLRPADWVVLNVYFKKREEIEAQNPSEAFRCGWTCPKAVGNAALRNRLKRWSRHWCRDKIKDLTSKNQLPPDVDLNLGFRAMPEGFYLKLKYNDFCLALDVAWQEILRLKR